MNLTEWANLQGKHPQTAYRWFREGTMPVPARQMGRLILVGDLATPNLKVGLTALYVWYRPATNAPTLIARWHE